MSAGAFEGGDGCAGVAAEFVGDEEPDAAGHQYVVVMAVLCAERAVGLAFVGGQFVDGFRVPFPIGGVADGVRGRMRVGIRLTCKKD